MTTSKNEIEIPEIARQYPLLTYDQLARVSALRAARSVLESKGAVFTGSSLGQAGHRELAELADYILNGFEEDEDGEIHIQEMNPDEAADLLRELRDYARSQVERVENEIARATADEEVVGRVGGDVVIGYDPKGNDTGGVDATRTPDEPTDDEWITNDEWIKKHSKHNNGYRAPEVVAELEDEDPTAPHERKTCGDPDCQFVNCETERRQKSFQ